MKEEVFEKELRRALQQPCTIVRENHFEETILLVKEEARRKKKRERFSFLRFLIMQGKYIGWKIWGVQGMVLLIISYLLTCFYHYRVSPPFVAKLMFYLSVLVFMTALPFIYRSVRYQMQEIEAATRFSSVKLLMARLIIIFIGDVFMMSGIFFTTIIKTSLQADSILLYLCFPFLLVTAAVCLCWDILRQNIFSPAVWDYAYFSLSLFAAPGQYGALFQQSFSVRWLAVCLLLISFCIKQFYYITHHSCYTEMQIA